MTTETPGWPQRDDPLTRALRALHAPPADESYWAALERRVLEAIDRAEASDGWWRALAGWARLGALAAAAALLLAVYETWQVREAQEQMAFQALVESARSVPLQVATEHSAQSAREATLRYVISP